MGFDIYTPLIHYTFHEGSLLEAQYQADIPLITKDIAEEIVAERLSFQGGRKYRLLLHGETKLNITGAAKNYFSSEKGLEGISAVAILFDNWTIYTIMRFVARFKRTGPPMAIFREPAAARTWLETKEANPAEPEFPHRSLAQQYADHFFESHSDIQFILDPEDRITRANEAACKRMACSEDELAGRPLSALLDENGCLRDAAAQPICVTLSRSALPEGQGGRRETLLTAREVGVGVIREQLERALTITREPRERQLLEAAREALFPPTETLTVELTRSQRLVIDCMAKGFKTRETARLLGKSPRTIDTQKRELYKKFKVKNGVELIQKIHDLRIQ